MNIIKESFLIIFRSTPATIYLCVMIFLSIISSALSDLRYKIIILGLLAMTSYFFGYYYGVSAARYMRELEDLKNGFSL